MDIVSYKTAKLAEEKGFNEKCFYNYTREEFREQFSDDGNYKKNMAPCEGENIYNNVLSKSKIILNAPYQSQLQKWWDPLSGS